MGRVCYGYPRAHPRLRGADFASEVLVLRGVGSSPLTRGGRHLRQAPWLHRGLIPAYAGRTPEFSHSTVRGGAHPRLRGADRSPAACTLSTSGSSPLTRGGRNPRMAKKTAMGLIPAYAGRTRQRSPEYNLLGAHPRLRGADFRASSLVRNPRGSSPLTRGGHLDPLSGNRRVGLIPAYAGRTSPQNQ
ncbi:Domain of uncharacterised function (DUF2825) [Corynebacterium striatum]|nr:Domain of uncharacterised function (DUF2825) [Corynebacterium striatum]